MICRISSEGNVFGGKGCLIISSNVCVVSQNKTEHLRKYREQHDDSFPLSTVSPSPCCIGLWNNYSQNCSEPLISNKRRISLMYPCNSVSQSHTHAHTKLIYHCLPLYYLSLRRSMCAEAWQHSFGLYFFLTKTPRDLLKIPQSSNLLSFFPFHHTATSGSRRGVHNNLLLAVISAQRCECILACVCVCV